MARNRAIDATLTLPGITRPVGRPRKADALTNAQRQKLWRQRQKVAAISVTRNGNSVEGEAAAVVGLVSGFLCNTRTNCNGLQSGE